MWRPNLTLLLAAGAATMTCATWPATGAGDNGIPAAPGPLLPDLDQQTPSMLEVTRAVEAGRPQYLLGFQSAVRNIGEGPLVIVASRPSTRAPLMTAEQVVERGDGGQGSTPGVGSLRYTIARGHHHWHLLRFDRYELRRADGGGAVLRDHKSGFCLGDRYRVLSLVVPGSLGSPTYHDNCGLYRPQRLRVVEGISSGYGDNYLPYLEGQSLPLSGLPAGRYVLVHRVNEDHRLLESNYANDAASVLLDLRWRAGAPALRILKSCSDSDVCS